jgi:outer membrane protein assembly factor BamD
VISALMPTLFPRRPALLAWIAALLALAATPRLAADLTWSPSTGWRVEEGALSGLTGAKGHGALDLMNKARRDEEAGSISAAIKGYEKVSSKYQGSVFAPEALYRAGKLLQGRKQYYKAFTAYQTVLRLYPNTKRFNEVIGEQYRIASALLDGAHNRMLGGLLPGFSNRTKGLEFFEVILLNAPYSDYAPLSLMDIARGYQRDNSKEEAIDALDRLVNTYPQSVLAPVAYLRLGDLHASLSEGPKYDQASTKEAMTYYEDYMILYPGDSNIAIAAAGVDRMKTTLAQSKIYIGDFYFYKRQNYRAARVFYNEAITSYPESGPAGVAKRRLAEVDAKMTKSAVGAVNPPKKRWFWPF